MATNRVRSMAGVLTRTLSESPSVHREADGAFLTSFIDRRDPAAFAELVRRHGPMVLGVCLRVLRHRQDAGDAFQATFLVLARKAGTVSPPNAVSNWLYGVAHQTAVRARSLAMKRREREALVPQLPEPAVRESGWDDLAEVLDEELGRLPNHYRTVIVLCDVEGRTREDAAAHLNCPEGSVSSRLSRAREVLARRLAGRGVTLSVTSLAAHFGQHAATAAVPPVLQRSLVDAAVSATATALPAAVSPTVHSLTQGALNAMLQTKLKAVAAVLLVLALLGTSLAVFVPGPPAQIGADSRGAGPASRPAEGGRGTQPVAVASKPDEPDGKNELVGTWAVVENGGENPVRPGEHELGARWVFTGSQLLFDTEADLPESERPGRFYSVDRSKAPTRITVSLCQRAGGGPSSVSLAEYHGVYEVRGNTLRWYLSALEPAVAFPPAGGGEQSRVLTLRRERPVDRTVPEAVQRLAGDWMVVEERAWQPIPKERQEQITKGAVTWRFRDDLVQVLDGTSLGVRYRVDPAKSPGELHPLDGKGERVESKWRYDLRGDTLRVFGWHPRAGVEPTTPRGFEPDDYPEEAWNLLALERVAGREWKQFEGRWKSADCDTVFEFRGNRVSYSYADRVASEGSFLIRTTPKVRQLDLALRMIHGPDDRYLGIYEFQADGSLRVALERPEHGRPTDFLQPLPPRTGLNAVYTLRREERPR